MWWTIYALLAIVLMVLAGGIVLALSACRDDNFDAEEDEEDAW